MIFLVIVIILPMSISDVNLYSLSVQKNRFSRKILSENVFKPGK